jgi:hypothetical protein
MEVLALVFSEGGLNWSPTARVQRGEPRPRVARARETDQAALTVPLEFHPNSLPFLPITNPITFIIITHCSYFVFTPHASPLRARHIPC